MSEAGKTEIEGGIGILTIDSAPVNARDTGGCDDRAD